MRLPRGCVGHATCDVLDQASDDVVLASRRGYANMPGVSAGQPAAQPAAAEGTQHSVPAPWPKSVDRKAELTEVSLCF
eukprot:COSAG01_NODE_1853_length_9060_cov_13.741576_12_plen_78_part_00